MLLLCVHIFIINFFLKITLAEEEQEYERMLNEMKCFYMHANPRFQAAKLEINNVYVVRLGDHKYMRVRVAGFVEDVSSYAF